MNSFETSYNRLNAEQKKAVDTIYGPVMVVAGPGTGKTQMLSIRIANILKNTDAMPENILCLTFTEAGVKAMKQRLKEFIGPQAYKVDVFTFHGFANDVIQSNTDVFKFNDNASQIDELLKLKLIQDILEQLNDPNIEQKLIPFYDKYAKQHLIIKAIQTFKKEGIGPEELLSRVREELSHHLNNVVEYRGKPTKVWTKRKEKLEALLELYEVYKLYQAKLMSMQAYDYEDMILFVVNEFRANPSILADYQEQYQFINVDEYQDTNGSQNELLELLGSNQENKPNIFVVGDDDQAIFRFQGANIDNILKFNTKFPDTNIIATIVNYRSTQAILNVAESLISNNQNRLTKLIPNLDKVLKSHSDQKYKDHVEIHEFNNATAENLYIANEILRLNKQEKVEFNQIAVLYRNNSDILDTIEVLNKYKIPTELQKSDNIWESDYVNKFVQLIKATNLYERLEDELLYSILLFDFVDIEETFVYKFAHFAKRKRLGYLDIFTNKNTLLEFTTKLDQNLKDEVFKAQELITKLFSWHKLAHNTSFVRFSETVLNESGLLSYLSQLQDIESINKLTKMFEYIQSNSAWDKNYDLETFLRDVELALTNKIELSITKVQASTPSVYLSTVHGSKGLEFDHVFLIKASDSNWGKFKAAPSLIPNDFISLSDQRTSKDILVEDERRLFFVAITRAKKHVVITHSSEYSKNGYVSSSIHSRFIDEIDDNLKVVVEHKQNIDLEGSTNLLKITPQKEYSKLMQSYLLSQVENFSLSPSTLNAYLRSPKDFLYRYLLSMPHTKTKEESLGIAVHKALEFFNQGLIKNKIVSKSDFLDVFANAIYKDYSEFEDYNDTKQEGLRLIEMYYDSVLSKIDSSQIAATEYNFSSHNVLFNIPSQDPIKLTGRIDALKYLDRDTNTVKVIDYKTSKFKSENVIKGSTSQSTGDEFRQLVFYKLVSQIDDYFRVDKSLSKPKYIVETGEIVFIKPYKVGVYRTTEVTITNEDVDALKELIIEAVNRIRNLEFPEKCDI